MEGLLAEPQLLANAQRPLPMALEKLVQFANDFTIRPKPHPTRLIKSCGLTSVE